VPRKREGLEGSDRVLVSPMYDNTYRFLAENFSADFASWLLGEPITLTEIKPSELSLEPIRADALRGCLKSSECPL